MPITDRDIDWTAAIQVDYDTRDLRREAPEDAVYVLSDAPIGNKTWFRSATARPQEPPPPIADGHATGQSRAQAVLARRRDARSIRCALSGRRRCRPRTQEVAKIRDRLDGQDRTSSTRPSPSTRIVSTSSRPTCATGATRTSSRSAAPCWGASWAGAPAPPPSRGRRGVRPRVASSSAQRIRTIENRIEEKNLAIEDLEDDLREADRRDRRGVGGEGPGHRAARDQPGEERHQRR